MLRYLLFAVVVLLGASSCTPQRAHTEQLVPPARAETRPGVLLRELALDVPDDLVAARTGAIVQALPPRVVPAAAPPFLAVTRTPDDAARAMECLTQAVYYEARSETEDGQRAVAQVVLNRVRDRAFPGSVCGVVYQGSTRRTGCQFSFTCDGSMNHPREPSAWARAAAVASAALSGSVYAPIGSATFYHANYVLPWWAASMARIGNVGAHIFYSWRGAMERALAYRQVYTGSEPGVPAPATAPMIFAGQGAVAAEQEMVAGVTIHRSGTQAAPALQSAVVAAIAPTPMATPKRAMIVSGVRIHVGARMPLPVATGGATIGEESDPS